MRPPCVRRSPSARSWSPFLAACVTIGLLAGCDGSASSPAAPSRAAFEMTAAQVVVDGRVVNGTEVPARHNGPPTRFEARLEADHRPVTGGVVYCQYQRPDGHGRHRQGVFTMYDDGTHGDHTPGDGLYCLEDDRGQYGCHGDGAGPGTYHYEFWGRHPSWGETGHHRVTVTVR